MSKVASATSSIYLSCHLKTELREAPTHSPTEKKKERVVHQITALEARVAKLTRGWSLLNLTRHDNR